MDFLFCFVFMTLVFTLSVYLYRKQTKAIAAFFKNLPCPPTKLFFGHSFALKTHADFIKNAHRFVTTYGRMVHLKLGPFGHVLLTTDTEFFALALNNPKQFNKSAGMRFWKPWFGEGIVLAENLRWKKHRKLLSPAFQFHHLRKLIDDFESASNELISKLLKLGPTESLDISPLVLQSSLKINYAVTMGTDVDVDSSEAFHYIDAAEEMLRIHTARSISLLKRFDCLYRFTTDYRKQQQALKFLLDLPNKIINQKRQQRKLCYVDNQESYNNMKNAKTLLDLLFENVENGVLTDHEMNEEINNILAAGLDTTATATSFVIYCIANNKDIQDRVFEEQLAVYGKNRNPKTTLEDFENMIYLENVIKETLRMYPSFPVASRRLTEDVTYQGQVIPKGVEVMLFIYGVHMDPLLYPNPTKFDPSRFDDMDAKSANAFLSFGAGPRICLGQKQAMLQIKSVVAKIVRNFQLFPAYPEHEIQLTVNGLLKSENGLKIGFRARQGKSVDFRST